MFYYYFLVRTFGLGGKKKRKLNDDAVYSVFSFTKLPTKKRKFYIEKTAKETKE